MWFGDTNPPHGDDARTSINIRRDRLDGQLAGAQSERNSDTFPPDVAPTRTIPPPFLHGVGHSPIHHHHHLPIYNPERSTVNMYNIDGGRSVRVMQEYGLVPVFTKFLASWVGLGPRRGSVRVRSMG